MHRIFGALPVDLRALSISLSILTYHLYTCIFQEALVTYAPACWPALWISGELKEHAMHKVTEQNLSFRYDESGSVEQSYKDDDGGNVAELLKRLSCI